MTKAYSPRPLLVSRLSRLAAVAVRSKCRPIRLLSGAVPLCAPTVKLPWRSAYLVSIHAYGETPRVIWHLPPSRHLPLTRKQLLRTSTPWFVLR